MDKDGQNRTLMLRAGGVSIGLHLAVLSIMAVLTFCPSVGNSLQAGTLTPSVQSLYRPAPEAIQYLRL